jgi:hypothetical protein
MGYYSIKGDTPREWIQGISLSLKKAKEEKDRLNRQLIDLIEKGSDVAMKYLKTDPAKGEWSERIYDTSSMNEDEYALFYFYRYKNQLPFKIQETDII